RRRWKVEPDVAIKFPISRITRITFGRAPDLPARIAIARKHRRPMRSETRRVDGATRARIAKDQPMGVDDEPTKVRFVQNRIETGTVSALRKPETSRIGAESSAVRIAADENLRAHRFARLLQQRQRR